MDSYSADDLAKLLAGFYVDARKKDWSKYKMSCLKAIRFGLSRHFSKEMGISITQDGAFKRANEVFSAVTVPLKREGLGQLDHTPSIEPHELQQMYNNDALNVNTPVGRLHNVWFDIMFTCVVAVVKT